MRWTDWSRRFTKLMKDYVMIECRVRQNVGQLTPHKALLFYGSGNGATSRMTIHPVEIIGSTPILKEGTLVRKSDLRKLANGIEKKRDAGLRYIADNILARDDEQVVWWVPPCKQRMYFKTQVLGLENFNGEVSNPACVFARTRKGWQVLCLAGNERPTMDTPLLVSPYFNVWDNHVICVGSTALPKSDDVLLWTKAYFASAFTHTNYRNKKHELNRLGDRAALWRDLLTGKLTDFPCEVLPDAGMTLGEFIAEINKHG